MTFVDMTFATPVDVTNARRRIPSPARSPDAARSVLGTGFGAVRQIDGSLVHM